MIRAGDIKWSTPCFPNYWSVNITSMWIDGVDVSFSKVGILSGKPYIGVPMGEQYLIFEAAVLHK